MHARRRLHLRAIVVAVVAVAGAMAAAAGVGVSESPGPDAAGDQVVPPTTTLVVRNQLGFAFPPAPSVPEGAPSEALVTTIDDVFADPAAGLSLEAARAIVDAGDARAAWLISDLVRFLGPSELRDELLAGFERLTGASLADDPVSVRSPWQSMTDHLMAWDLPALEGYPTWKGRLFTIVEPGWQPFFDDADSAIDWRLVSWGGVLIDDRPFGDGGPCERCIPALDDPPVTDAAGGVWYPDDALVFGISVNGESRAYPKNIMEVHEMVNDELGGRRIAVPYCTLCGSAQAYLTDDVAGAERDMLVLRTSGLLSRSNKVMYELETRSVFDTFTGEALSGPLGDAEVELEPVSVVTSTWGEWKGAHPETTILTADGGLGRSYPLDPLRGRDDGGPIFPIGDVDERLSAQELVLGVFADDGTPVAFPVVAGRAALDAGRSVSALGLELVPDASGLRAIRADGSEAVSHEAFWFAWSQFYPDTVVWAAP